MEVYIVIPVFNGWTQTRQCLEALRRSHCQDFHTIIVDHGSTDETANRLDTDYPEITCITAPDLLWWSGATNTGIKYAISAGATHIMLLNNDSYPETGCIGSLLSNYTSHEQPRIIASRLLDNSTLAPVASAGRSCFALGFPILILCAQRYSNSDLTPCKLIMGARGVIIPTEIFTQIGLFDAAHLPHYWADQDFYLRCNKAGVPLLIDPSARVRVDNTRTTMARGLANMSLHQFKATLHERKSHRNIQDLTQLFRKHYPIPGLYAIGVALNLGRYILIYLIMRTTHVFRQRPKSAS